jgi:peptidyl-prolyl cis-trans isomerase C
MNAPEPAPDGAVAPPARRSPVGRWLRDPLLHFLVVGGLLFAGYGVLSPGPDPRQRADRIELTVDDLRQLSVTWIAQGRPPPTPEQLRSLVESRVQQEVLAREAAALGLDKDDAVIERRLAQKMEFLAEDASPRDPTREELRVWFAQHPGPFTLPPRASFRHLYFSADRRGAGARDAAVRAAQALAGEPASSPKAAALADPFMFQDYYGDRSPEQLAKEFGPGFARVLFGLEPGSWQGPIESGYGWHLVWVDSLTPSRVPALEEVEPDVRAAWLEDQQARTKREAFAAMRARYTVVLPPLDQLDLRALAATAPPPRQAGGEPSLAAQ